MSSDEPGLGFTEDSDAFSILQQTFCFGLRRVGKPDLTLAKVRPGESSRTGLLLFIFHRSRNLDPPWRQDSGVSHENSRVIFWALGLQRFLVLLGKHEDLLFGGEGVQQERRDERSFGDLDLPEKTHLFSRKLLFGKNPRKILLGVWRLQNPKARGTRWP